MSRPLLLWTGGLDSTFMLQRALSDTNVDVAYVSGLQGHSKISKENAARDNIRRRIERTIEEDDNRNYRGRIVTFYEVKYDVTYAEKTVVTAEGETKGDMVQYGETDSFKNVAYQQMPQLLQLLMSAVNPNIHTEVQMAYVMGDSIVYHLKYLQEAWESLCKILYTRHVLDVPFVHVPLRFPLIAYSKAKIAQALNAELFPHCWWCEGQTDTPCMKCVPCISFAKMVYELELTYPEYRNHPKGFLGHKQDDADWWNMSREERASGDPERELKSDPEVLAVQEIPPPEREPLVTLP